MRRGPFAIGVPLLWAMGGLAEGTLVLFVNMALALWRRWPAQ